VSEYVCIGSCTRTNPRLATPLRSLLEDPQTTLFEEEEEEEKRKEKREETDAIENTFYAKRTHSKEKKVEADAIASELHHVREGETSEEDAIVMFRALLANRQSLCSAWHIFSKSPF
jgi:hypothetical protein